MKKSNRYRTAKSPGVSEPLGLFLLNFQNNPKKHLTNAPIGCIIHNVRRIMKGSEDMSEMTAEQTVRLIEWLKAKGLTDSEIVECFEYINKSKKR